jgi:hypothetical protein
MFPCFGLGQKHWTVDSYPLFWSLFLFHSFSQCDSLWDTLFVVLLVGIGSMDGLSHVCGWVTVWLVRLFVRFCDLLLVTSGRYMTELEVEQRVEDMVQTRQNMMDQLEYRVLQDQKQQEESRRKPRKQQQ